jgi:hypothetical protein
VARVSERVQMHPLIAGSELIGDLGNLEHD